ncbi:MAG: N-acetylmuramic acid 6-phosphate etherase [Actinomycetota bacterium]|nr:N-acetylmuramic acid 6-phosphate etherase [Actinomycetota bacterium]
MIAPRGLDEMGTAELIDALLVAQNRVPDAVAQARPAIRAATELLVDRLGAGGRLLLAGAGTSGRLAWMEAAELPGTFGVAPESAVGVLAGAKGFGLSVGDEAEDDAQLALEDIRALTMAASDCLVAVAASGSTPYTVSAAAAARAIGAAVISVTTSAESPLALIADVPIEVLVGPEVLDGSTRMASGTAQKVVLNTLTTAVMVRLGHVHDRYMIDVEPANEKLRRRAVGIVAAIAGVDAARAGEALRDCHSVRAALIHLALDVEPEDAALRAAAHRSLREALRP